MQVIFPGTKLHDLHGPELPPGGMPRSADKMPDQQLDEDLGMTKDNIQILQDSLAEGTLSLKFTRDAETGKLVVEIMDDKTGVAIRQMPSEISLRLSEILSTIQGQFVNRQV